MFAESIMTNSTWTQNHIQALLSAARNSFAASILLMDETSDRKKAERGEKVEKKECKVVYPPCDVKSLLESKLEKRGRGIVSLAQFR
jgi:alpha-1,2-mannosyltransferase